MSTKKDGGSIAEYGGVNFQLRSRKGGEYIHLPLATSNKGWHHEWFMIRNFEPPLPAFTGAAPAPSDAWKWGPAVDERKKLEVVLVQVAALVREGLTGEAVLRTFYARRIQPLRSRVHGMWRYAGPSDSTRESADELAESEVNARVRSVLEEKALVDLGPQPTPLSADRPSTRVSFRKTTNSGKVQDLDRLGSFRIISDIPLF